MKSWNQIRDLLNLRYRKVNVHFTPPAYLDPGSGSFLIQILLAVLLGLGIAVRASWGRIKGWFGVKPKVDETDDNEDDAQ